MLYLEFSEQIRTQEELDTAREILKDAGFEGNFEDGTSFRRSVERAVLGNSKVGLSLTTNPQDKTDVACSQTVLNGLMDAYSFKGLDEDCTGEADIYRRVYDLREF